MKQAHALQPSTSNLMSELPPIENNYETKGKKNKDDDTPLVEAQTPAIEAASTSSPTTTIPAYQKGKIQQRQTDNCLEQLEEKIEGGAHIQNSQPHTANNRTCPPHRQYPHLPSVVTWHLFLHPRVSPPTPTPSQQICATDCRVAEWVDGYGWVTGEELEQLKQCLALSRPSPSLPPLTGAKGARKAACSKTGVVAFTFISNNYIKRQS
jgi:hypothetical protein